MRLGVQAAVVDGELVPGDVEVADGRIAAVGLAGAGEGVAVPGLVDLQVNGYDGVDVLDADELALVAMGMALARDGVTAYQPTLITSPPQQALESLRSLERARARGGAGARMLGAHLEGPFLSPARPGAHPLEHLKAPDPGLLDLLLGEGLPVTTVTLAPELPGALVLVERLAAAGVVVSLGHSDARAFEAHAGFAAGARTVTHLFNAMRPFGHRDPGLVGTALARDDVVVQLIADGVHVADEAILTAWRAARGRLLLVSDVIAAAGLGDGAYRIGTVEVEVSGGVSRRADGTLAGAVDPLVAGLRTLVRLGVPLADAVDAVTRVPARLLGRDDVGRLAPGVVADVVVLDGALAVRRVLLAGMPVGD